MIAVEVLDAEDVGVETEEVVGDVAGGVVREVV